MRKPDFFMVGAPKCGTTSLYRYLERHPEIFVPRLKEPHHFAGDMGLPTNPPDHRVDREAYLRLFRGADERHKAVGEASVWYLYAPGALEQIREFAPDARFIAMVRNPVEMAPSLHAQMLLSLEEDASDFGVAWRLQDQRRRGESLPKGNTDRRFLLYGETCALGAQIESFFRIVPEEQRMVIVLDDLRRDAADVYRNVLEFLQLEDDGQEEFPVLNARRVLVRPRIAYLNARIPQWKWWANTKRRLGLPYGTVFKVPGWVYLRKATKSSLSPGLERELMAFFRADIEKLGQLLKRDLSKWVRSPS